MSPELPAELDLSGGPVWVAADLHLGPDTPATRLAFLHFLESARRQARALLLYGDLFEAWIGDDVVRRPAGWLLPLLDAMADTAAHCPLWIGRGNRDFLLGTEFTRRIGARLLSDSVRLRTDAGLALVSHGDEYCLQDRGYQRLRRWLRHPAVQGGYLALPLSLRQRIALWARRRSRQANADKPAYLMDVDPGAIQAALREHGAALLVHGHTHRPVLHALTVDGRPALRIVLPDWDLDHAPSSRGGWLVLDHQGARLHSLPGVAPSWG